MASRWSGVTSQADQAHWRRKISVTKLIQRLDRFALADPDNADCPRMTRTQAMIALALLRKVLPDVATVEVSGPGGSPISVQVLRFSDGKVIDLDPVTSSISRASIPTDNVDALENSSDINELE